MILEELRLLVDVNDKVVHSDVSWLEVSEELAMLVEEGGREVDADVSKLEASEELDLLVNVDDGNVVHSEVS